MSFIMKLIVSNSVCKQRQSHLAKNVTKITTNIIRSTKLIMAIEGKKYSKN